MGYDAPDELPNLGVGSANMARDGGQLMAADVNALNVTHDGSPSHLTVLGHSYGSTTVSDAAAGFGMRADDVVLVGCPGTDMAKSAADFHLPPDGHLYVGAASTVAVTHFGKGQVPIPGMPLGWVPIPLSTGSVPPGSRQKCRRGASIRCTTIVSTSRRGRNRCSAFRTSCRVMATRWSTTG